MKTKGILGSVLALLPLFTMATIATIAAPACGGDPPPEAQAPAPPPVAA
ncbi:MAG: hypothetical protein JWP97_3390, partial [Labilithrix sp.]|nr:hypothetical protein [Labilithrix sp.]